MDGLIFSICSRNYTWWWNGIELNYNFDIQWKCVDIKNNYNYGIALCVDCCIGSIEYKKMESECLACILSGKCTVLIVIKFKTCNGHYSDYTTLILHKQKLQFDVYTTQDCSCFNTICPFFTSINTFSWFLSCDW